MTAVGSGAGHAWVLTIGGLSSIPFGNTSYGNPVVSSYQGVGTVGGDASCAEYNSDGSVVAVAAGGDGGTVDCGATEGGQAVVVLGENFGTPALGNELFVTYGPTGEELTAQGCVISANNVQITCATAPGAGAGPCVNGDVGNGVHCLCVYVCIRVLVLG